MQWLRLEKTTSNVPEFIAVKGKLKTNFLVLRQGYLQNLGTTKRSNMKKNRYEVWKQTFSELDFETLRLISAGLGISPSARHHRPAGRNEPYYPIENFEARQSITSFFSAWGIYMLYCRGERPFSTCLRWGTRLAPAPSLLRIIAPILRKLFH